MGLRQRWVDLGMRQRWDDLGMRQRWDDLGMRQRWDDLGMRQRWGDLGMGQTFILDCVSALPVSSFWEKLCSSASFSAMMACNDLSLLSRRDILACVHTKMHKKN